MNYWTIKYFSLLIAYYFKKTYTFLRSRIGVTCKKDKAMITKTIKNDDKNRLSIYEYRFCGILIKRITIDYKIGEEAITLFAPLL